MLFLISAVTNIWVITVANIGGFMLVAVTNIGVTKETNIGAGYSDQYRG